MLLEASGLGSEAHFDYCIIGSGPAGITLALGLESTGKRIALLEAGDENVTAESQALYEGSVIGDPDVSLASARLRCFGGTSNHWAGWCRHLDAADFLPKPYCAHTGWPLRKTDLDPYFDAARRLLSLREFRPDQAFADSGLQEFDIPVSSEARLAKRFRERIVGSANIHLVLKANVTSLSTNGAAVTSANVVDYAKRRSRVRADVYAVAAGGIENSRLLLWSNAQSNGQLIRHSATLGRYWTEHPIFVLGEAFLIGNAGLDPKQHESGVHCVFLSPTAQTMLAHEALSCGLRMQFEYTETVKKNVAAVACVAPKLGRWLANLFNMGLLCGVRIAGAWEQQPREQNRIELSDEVDALGMPKVLLHWRKSELDRRTARAAMEVLGRYCAQKNLGRIRLDDWLLDDRPFPSEHQELAGYHHMGGTRMAATPADGIVDRNCKVFDQENLYIAGSSVFPTGGHANPTFTIVQLAARLADHLRSRSRPSA